MFLKQLFVYHPRLIDNYDFFFKIILDFYTTFLYTYHTVSKTYLDMIMKFEIWTDGGFVRQPALGAWAFIILSPSNDRIERYALVDHHKQTSQVAEIMAILKSFQCMLHDVCKGDEKLASKLSLDVYSDSQYCVNSITSWMYSWQRSDWQVDKHNLDLWKQVYDLKHKFKSVKMNWVKGHAGIDLNEQVDKLTNIPLKAYRK